MSQVNSCKSCTCSGNQNCGVSSPGGGWKRLGVTLICQCGEVAIMRTARTSRNAGKKLWGCPNFKVRLLSVFYDFFVICDCK